MLEAGTLWELIEARAAATPDALDGRRRGRPRDDLRRVPRPGGDRGSRAGAGARDRAGRRHHLAAPDLARVHDPGRGDRAARRRAEPGAADLPPAGGRLLRPPGRVEAARRAVELRHLRLRRHGRRDRRRPRRRRGHDLGPLAARRAIRPRCRRRRRRATRCAGCSTRRAPRPTRRAPSTPTDHHRRRRGHEPAPRRHRRRPQRAGLPLHPRRRHHLAVHQPDDRHGQHPLRGVRARPGGLGAESPGRHARRFGHRLPPGLPGGATAPATRRSSRSSRTSRAAGRPSPCPSTTR